MKMITVQLQEALDQINAKDPKAAKQLHESKGSVEQKLTACQALLNGTRTAPAWRESATDKLVHEIRESSPAFRLVIEKHNGVMDNSFAGRSSAGTGDDTSKLLVETAMRAFNMTEAQAKVFAGVEGDSDLVKAIKEGGGR